MNKKGEKPLSLQEDNKAKAVKKPIDLLADTDISRFDKAKKKKRKNNKNKADKQAAAGEQGNGKQQKAPRTNRPDNRNRKPKAESRKGSGYRK